jgi:hypothetical protein
MTVREAIARGVIGFDAVKHLVLCRIERRPPRLDLTVYPCLPRATVAITSARSYLDLLTGASSGAVSGFGSVMARSNPAAV